MSRYPDSNDTLATLPIKILESGTGFFRVSGIEHVSSIFYSTNTENRWTPESGAPGVCYMAATEIGALAESECRNVAKKKAAQMVSSLTALGTRGMFVLELFEPIKVLDLTIHHLGKYRLDAGILSDYDDSRVPPYRYCPTWAQHCAELGLGGILYRSRHKTDEVCVALFDRGVKLTEFLAGTLDADRYLDILENEFNWGLIP